MPHRRLGIPSTYVLLNFLFLKFRSRCDASAFHKGTALKKYTIALIGMKRQRLDELSSRRMIPHEVAEVPAAGNTEERTHCKDGGRSRNCDISALTRAFCSSEKWKLGLGSVVSTGGCLLCKYPSDLSHNFNVSPLESEFGGQIPPVIADLNKCVVRMLDLNYRLKNEHGKSSQGDFIRKNIILVYNVLELLTSGHTFAHTFVHTRHWQL